MSKNPIPLLPCPWCGSEDVSLIHHEDANIEVVACMDESCLARGPERYQNEAQAIAAWNKGPYADRLEIHVKTLRAHAEVLRSKADEHRAKADELENKANAALLSQKGGEVGG
jgi:hypothetical protein